VFWASAGIYFVLLLAALSFVAYRASARGAKR
jgi:hypothetical protein